MRKIKMLLIILGLVFISGCIYEQKKQEYIPESSQFKPGSGQFKPGSEPDGFRGIKWGTDISTLSNMKYVRTTQGYGGVQMYVREGDELKIGDAILERIEYSFWRGKFCDVWIYTKGFKNFDNLKEAVFEKFGAGEPYKKDEDGEMYSWFGKNTSMILSYNKSSEVGILWMFSSKIAHQMEEYRKQKVREGADKGF